MNKIKLYWDIISPGIGLMFMATFAFFAVGLVLSIPLCLLWNWLMPMIFGLPTLNILEIFGLTILISLLSPRKIDLMDNKNKTTEKVNSNIDELSENFEKVLDDFQSQLKS
tara:strand:+ start:340 stop:672 length:333 start_codon:yes stop_codon:yes gene_type:complete